MIATEDWGARAQALFEQRGVNLQPMGNVQPYDEVPVDLPDPTPVFDRLLASAMLVCDRHEDGPEARAEMRRDCEALSPRLQADLLEHFQGKPAFPTAMGTPPLVAQPSRACAYISDCPQIAPDGMIPGVPE